MERALCFFLLPLAPSPLNCSGKRGGSRRLAADGAGRVLLYTDFLLQGHSGTQKKRDSAENPASGSPARTVHGVTAVNAAGFLVCQVLPQSGR